MNLLNCFLANNKARKVAAIHPIIYRIIAWQTSSIKINRWKIQSNKNKYWSLTIKKKIKLPRSKDTNAAVGSMNNWWRSRNMLQRNSKRNAMIHMLSTPSMMVGNAKFSEGNDKDILSGKHLEHHISLKIHQLFIFIKIN